MGVSMTRCRIILGQQSQNRSMLTDGGRPLEEEIEIGDIMMMVEHFLMRWD